MCRVVPARRDFRARPVRCPLHEPTATPGVTGPPIPIHDRPIQGFHRDTSPKPFRVFRVFRGLSASVYFVVSAIFQTGGREGVNEGLLIQAVFVIQVGQVPRLAEALDAHGNNAVPQNAPQPGEGQGMAVEEGQ